MPRRCDSRERPLLLLPVILTLLALRGGPSIRKRLVRSSASVCLASLR